MEASHDHVAVNCHMIRAYINMPRKRVNENIVIGPIEFDEAARILNFRLDVYRSANVRL